MVRSCFISDCVVIVFSYCLPHGQFLSACKSKARGQSVIRLNHILNKRSSRERDNNNVIFIKEMTEGL